MKSKLAIISFVLSIIVLLLTLFLIGTGGYGFIFLLPFLKSIFIIRISIPIISFLIVIISLISFYIIKNKNLEGKVYSLLAIFISLICALLWYILIPYFL